MNETTTTLWDAMPGAAETLGSFAELAAASGAWDAPAVAA